jgi:hypothetical protein
MPAIFRNTTDVEIAFCNLAESFERLNTVAKDLRLCRQQLAISERGFADHRCLLSKNEELQSEWKLAVQRFRDCQAEHSLLAKRAASTL